MDISYLIELFSLEIFDYMMRFVVAFVVYAVFKDFIVDNFKSWERSGFKGLTKSFLQAMCIVIATALVLSFGLPNILRYIWYFVELIFNAILTPIWKLITRT